MKDSSQGDINANEKPAAGIKESTVTPADDQSPEKQKDGQQVPDEPSMQGKNVSSFNAIDNEPRSRQPVSNSAAAVSPISPSGGSADKAGLAQKSQNAQDNKSEPTQTQVLPPPPLHGILKDGKKSNSGTATHRQEQIAHDREMHKYHQRQRLQGSSQYDPRVQQQQSDPQGNVHQQIYGDYSYDHQSSKAPPRGNSLRGRDDGIYQQMNYNTLPRKSALSNPVSDGPKDRYNSLPRRAQKDNVPSSGLTNPDNDNYNSWGSLDRKTESDSGFGALDRSFSSTGSSNYAHYPPQHSVPSSTGHRPNRPLNYAAPDGSNYAMISSSGRGRPRPVAYPTASQPYHPPRPDSVPPLGSKNSLGSTGDVFFEAARPGSVPPQHPNNAHGYYSETEVEVDRSATSSIHRGHRAGSVPLGYESESAAYGYTHPSRSNHYDLDSGQYQRHHYPNSNNNRPSRGLRVHPDDEKYRAGPGKKPVPRRHTVGTPHRAASLNVDRKDPVSTLISNLILKCTVRDSQCVA